MVTPLLYLFAGVVAATVGFVFYIMIIITLGDEDPPTLFTIFATAASLMLGIAVFVAMLQRNHCF